MKKLVYLSLIFLGLALKAQAQGHAHADLPSVHGMLAVGTDQVYLSHLPMFHSPHDYQVILKVQLDPSALSTYKNAKKNSSETIYTFVPEVFSLPELHGQRKTFKGQLYKGHFERGGTIIVKSATVTVKQVMMFKKFDAAEAKPTEAKYLLFGNLTEQFMAHEVIAAPDFDQILQVKLDVSQLKRLAESKEVTPVIIPGKSNDEAIVEIGKIKIRGEQSLKPVELEVVSDLYTETGDLEN